ncbi:MAG: hypothetical protein LBV32_09010 [Tannerellaceae bacterium]|nr:hypothetical protein [Tannerellaceae bacterium]
MIVDKSSGKIRYLKTIGVSSDEQEIAAFFEQGKKWIDMHCGHRDMFLESERQREEKQVTEHLLNNVENILLNGTQLILNEVFRLVGFDAINDDILRHLVVARLCQPASKAGTVDYLKSYFDEDVELHKVYRYLDRLHNSLQDKIQRISVEHTRRILGGHIGLVFYDVTTLYFESDHSDELRERGFSKDGKHSQPQVVLGLLVSRDGYPLSYSLFNEENGIMKYLLEAEFDISNEIPLLRSGYSATAEIILNHRENVLSIEEKHIAYQKDSTCIYVLDKNRKKALRKNIELGVSDGVYTEIVNGVCRDEQIVINYD